jgi:endonuclease/exonuclease/phosphatase family metal-dependent hydrolase
MSYPQPTPAGGLRLVAWNIQQGSSDDRRDQIVERLRAWKPDVCILLEYTNSDASRWIRNRLHDAGLPHTIETVTPHSRRDEFGLLVAARWPLAVLDSTPEGATPLRWRLLHIQHTLPNLPAPLTLGAALLPGRSQRPGHKYRFLAALTELAQRWPEPPGLLVGDFGSGRQQADEEAPYFNEREHAFWQQMQAAGWADAFVHQHPHERRFSWQRRIEGTYRGLRVDQAFLHPALLPHLAACDLLAAEQDWPSDHAALLLDLRHGASE